MPAPPPRHSRDREPRVYPQIPESSAGGFDGQLLLFAEDLREENLAVGTSEILDAFDAEIEKLRSAPVDKATLDLAKVKARSWLYAQMEEVFEKDWAQTPSGKKKRRKDEKAEKKELKLAKAS